MKEFTTAVQDVAEEEEKKAKIVGLIAQKIAEGKDQATAEAEADAEVEGYIAFKVDGRVLHAYPPLPGQLAFMLASLGRGQTADGRFAAIINILLASLRDSDADYLESRLLSRDPKKRMPMEQIEEIFSFVTEEWFARPTQQSSDSAS